MLASCSADGSSGPDLAPVISAVSEPDAPCGGKGAGMFVGWRASGYIGAGISAALLLMCRKTTSTLPGAGEQRFFVSGEQRDRTDAEQDDGHGADKPEGDKMEQRVGRSLTSIDHPRKFSCP